VGLGAAEFVTLSEDDGDEAVAATALHGSRGTEADGGTRSPPSRWPKRGTVVVCGLSLLGGILCIILPLIILPTGSLGGTRLTSFVTLADVLAHMEALEVRHRHDALPIRA
jgi:hypothetical protein